MRCPSDARPRARRRAGAPHGRRRQGAASGSAARPSSSACWRGLRRNARASSSTPTAIRRASPHTGLPVVRRQRAGFRRAARRHSRRARLGGGACARDRRRRERAGRLPVPAARSGRAARMRRARQAGTPLACARSGDWRHPVVGLWPVALRDDLRHALIEEDLRKIEIWTARHGVAIADWPADAGRSVLQRQHARGRRRGRAHRGAAMRPLSA